MLLDTSFLIDLLGGGTAARILAEEVDRSGQVLRFPAPAMFELWVGAGKSLKQSEETSRLEALTLAYEIAPFTAEDARTSGLLQAALQREGKSLGTVDVQIAGMCLARDETLLTGDRRLSKVGHNLRTRTYPVRRSATANHSRQWTDCNLRSTLSEHQIGRCGSPPHALLRMEFQRGERALEQPFLDD